MIPQRKRKSKYYAKKVEYDGITFDSKLEGARYKILKGMLSRLSKIQENYLDRNIILIHDLYFLQIIELPVKEGSQFLQVRDVGEVIVYL